MKRTDRTVLAVAIAATAVLGATASIASNEPIPGVDIIVRKNPGGSLAVAGGGDGTGRLSGLVKEPGSYTVSIVCHTALCPKFTASLMASNGMLKQLPDMTYDLTVDRAPVTLTGAIKLIPQPNDNPIRVR